MALDLSALDAMVAPLGNAPSALAPTAPAAQFVEDPTQPRSEFEEDEEYLALVQDIRRRGILQPVIVRRLPSGMLQVRFGARRLRAAIAAGLSVIKYIETDDERQFDDYAQVAENRYRRPLQPLETAQFIERKLAAGEKKKQVAAALHLDPSAVTHLLALAYDPPALLLELYHSHRCRAPHLLYALRKLAQVHGAALGQALDDELVVDRQRVDALAATLAAGANPVVAESGRAAVEKGAGEVAAGGRRGSTGERAATTHRTESDTAPAGQMVPPEQTLAGLHLHQHQTRLIGQHQGALLEVLLDWVPHEEGLIWGRYLDDCRIAEMVIGEIVLTRLEFAVSMPDAARVASGAGEDGASMPAAQGRAARASHHADGKSR